MRSRFVMAFVLAACGGGGGGGNGPDAPFSCTTDTQCPAGGATPACDTTTGTCVQCTDSNIMACTGATPTCAPDHTCQGACEVDSDCASGACLGDGTCADSSAVLWVGNVAAGTCTLADKCALSVALTMVTATKNVIHMDPVAYEFATGFNLVGNFTLTGVGAQVRVDAGTAFTIPSGSSVKIDFLEIGGTMTTKPDEAISCTNGTFAGRRITVAFTGGIGINVSGCGTRIERSIVHDAQGGAIETGGGSVVAIFDNMIFHNGDAGTAQLGGIRLLGSVDQASRVEFNTIVDNAVPTGVAGAGIFCNSAIFTAPNNIIARNTVNGVADMGAQTGGLANPCTYPTSIVQADITGLNFASPDTAPLSYKLTAGSSAIDAATTATTVNVDFEDDSRPQGAQNDCGADEFKP